MSNKDTKNNQEKPFRNKVTWTLAVILVVVIILLMALPTSGFGILSAFSHRNDYVFGTFAGKKIEYSENSYLRRNYENLERSYSQYITEENRDSMSMFIWQQAYQNAAVMTALDYMAEKQGVVISDESVDKEITKLLTSEDGVFNRDYWASLSSSERKSIRSSVKSDLTRMKVVNDISASYVPSSEIDGLKSLSQYTESTDNAVKTSVEDSTTSRIVSAVLASPLYKDNFSEVYNKRIRTQNDSSSTVNESTEEISDTESADVQDENTEFVEPTDEGASEGASVESSASSSDSMVVTNGDSTSSSTAITTSDSNASSSVISTSDPTSNASSQLSDATISNGTTSSQSNTAPTTTLTRQRIKMQTSSNTYRTKQSIQDIAISEEL